ncbi:MAG: YvcK family protein [Caldisericia bacterium]
MTRRDLLNRLARPGIMVKRWYVLSLFGVVIIIATMISLDWVYNGGLVLNWFPEILQRIFDNPSLPDWFLPVFSWVGLILGLGIVIYGAIQVAFSLIPHYGASAKKQAPKAGIPNVVVIGGGSGTFPVLKALRMLEVNTTAIVTVADSGGSTGKLRDEMQIPAMGDIRRCLLALSDKPVFDKIIQHRFSKNGSLADHSLGNLIIAGLTSTEGDFAEAVYRLSKLMATKGQVIPFSIENISLCAKFEDGTTVSGEAEIPKIGKKISKVFFNPPHAKPYVRVLEALSMADTIIIGPGSLYTSLLPALLLSPIVDVIINSNAKRIFISNIMTQKGETDGYSVNDHIKAIIDHTGTDFFDNIIVTKSDIDVGILEKYRSIGSTKVGIDVDIDRERVIFADLAEVDSGVIRHSVTALARVLNSEIPKSKVKKFSGKE